MRKSVTARFRIAGKVWRWVYRPMRSCWGLCYYTNRRITIDPRHGDGLALLDTEIHEALHALQAFANEEHTADVATNLAQILHGLGYRRTDAVEHGRAYVGE